MSNQSFGRAVNPIEQWRAFDRLPPPIRQVIARAAFKYAVSGIEKDLRRHLAAGGTVAEFRQHLIVQLCDDLMRLAKKTYGPDHPDATTSRIKRRA